MLNFGLSAHEGFFRARLEGLVSVQAWDALLQDLAQAIPATGVPARLVIDMTAAVGYLGTPERTAVGALMARHLAQMEKVAIVVQQQKITGVVSAEAQRNGLNLRILPAYDDAVSWVTA